jgi:hypothetical protein
LRAELSLVACDMRSGACGFIYHYGDCVMPCKRRMNVVALVVVLAVGTMAVCSATGSNAVPAVVAQAPTIGATNTAAAETAQAGVTAIAATDAPPTPSERPSPTPIPPLTIIGTPGALGTPLAPTTLPSSRAAVVRSAPTVTPTANGASSRGGTSAGTVVGILAVIVIVGAVGLLLARNARARMLNR